MKTLLLSLVLILPSLALASTSEYLEKREELVANILEEFGAEAATDSEESETVTIVVNQDCCDSKTYVTATFGSYQVALLNGGIGMETKRISGDLMIGLGGLDEKNMKVVDGNVALVGAISLGLRYRLTQIVEVGLRAMQRNMPNATPEYSESFKRLGYDVRFNFETDKASGSSFIIGISGLKKGTFFPSFINAGFKMTL